MITFTYTDNSDEVTKSLAAFQATLADNAPALGEIADDFRAMVAEQFASEGRAGGTPWAARHHPSVPSSMRRGSAKRGVASASPLLVRSGELRDSLIGSGAGRVEEIDARSLTLGTSVPYAMLHQLGTRFMPARPVIVLSDARTQRWTEFVRRAIEEKAALLGAEQLK